MRVIKRIKEILLVPPSGMVFGLLMNVGFDGLVSLCMACLEGEEIVAALGLNLGSNRCLTAHGVDGHETTFDREQW